MKLALVDNGSLDPKAHLRLRMTAVVLSARIGFPVEAVSWKYSDRIPVAALDGVPAPLLTPWLRDQLARGQRDFVFAPFFISAKGATGSALRSDVERLQREHGGFTFTFADGLEVGGVLSRIVVDRVLGVISTQGLRAPRIVVVDHGGPSAASAKLRNRVAAEVRSQLSGLIGPVVAASLQGAAHPHNHPLFADVLAAPAFARSDVVIAPLFLASGRHSGSDGDLARMAAAAVARCERLNRQCQFIESIGAHPLVVETLAGALKQAISSSRLVRPPGGRNSRLDRKPRPGGNVPQPLLGAVSGSRRAEFPPKDMVHLPLHFPQACGLGRLASGLHSGVLS